MYRYQRIRFAEHRPGLRGEGCPQRNWNVNRQSRAAGRQYLWLDESADGTHVLRDERQNANHALRMRAPW